MHELSIVSSIIKTCEEQLVNKNKEYITEVFLQIGKLSGIEIPSLHFVWDLATKETVLENAKAIIEEPSGKAKCLDCETEYDLEKLYDSCPECKSPFKTILSGKEFKIKKIKISEK